MPQIQKIERKKKTYERKQTDMRALRAKCYSNSTWRKLRDTYMHSHPICEECLKQGKVTPAEDIHHKKSPFKGGEINYSLLLDPENLMALCKDCHAEHHNKERGIKTVQQTLEDLDILLSNNNEDNMKKDE